MFDKLKPPREQIAKRFDTKGGRFAVGPLRSFLKDNPPFSLRDSELRLVVRAYWTGVEDYKIQEDLPLIAAELNDRASRRNFIASTVIAVAALVVSTVALLTKP